MYLIVAAQNIRCDKEIVENLDPFYSTIKEADLLKLDNLLFAGGSASIFLIFI